MNQLRVLQVVTHMECGGLESMLMNYYRHIDREKFLREALFNVEYQPDVSSSQIVDNKNYIRESPKKLLTALCTPAGWMLTRYIRRKTKFISSLTHTVM